MSRRLHSTASEPERAVLVGTERARMLIPVAESLAELGRLAATAGVAVAGSTVQALRRIHPATFIGAGKVEAVKALAETAAPT